MWDLNVGACLDIYGKMFRLVDCDAFTRHFLSCQGVAVPAAEPRPAQQYEERRATQSATQPRKPYKMINTQSKFLENDGKVLRFFGEWPDGLDKRRLVLLYYLSDDTIQLNEAGGGAGAARPPTLLRRTRVPKEADQLVTLPGSLAERTVLNVVTVRGTGRRQRSHLIADNMDQASRPVLFYTAQDLSVGATLTLCGKQIFLYDCDEFTRDYYSVKYEREQLAGISVEQEVKRPAPRPVPPYTGLGTEEDSLTSWLGGNSLEPKPPQRDFFKFHKLDRHGYDSHVLRFAARLVNDKGDIDKYRKFVVAFFMADDSVLVSVLPEPGSGVQPGKFIEKCKMKKPQKFQSSDSAVHSTYYSAADFYVGAMLEFNCHTFLLTSADEYVFDFMVS